MTFFSKSTLGLSVREFFIIFDSRIFKWLLVRSFKYFFERLTIIIWQEKLPFCYHLVRTYALWKFILYIECREHFSKNSIFQFCKKSYHLLSSSAEGSGIIKTSPTTDVVRKNTFFSFLLLILHIFSAFFSVLILEVFEKTPLHNFPYILFLNIEIFPYIY